MDNYLTRETIVDLTGAIVECNMCNPSIREDLLNGINKRYIASLPQRTKPFDQIWSDLEEMNAVSMLSGGEVPLRIWLFNALDRLKKGGFLQQAILEQAYTEVVAESDRRIQANVPPTQIDALGTPGISKEYYRNILENFLLPFQGTLRFTRKIFDKLCNERSLNALEYHPGRLQQYFSTLPDEDPRKGLWMKYIDLLQEQNHRGLTLIYQFYGKITLPHFRDACDEYISHAEEWKLVWEALKGQSPISETLADSHNLLAPQFPAGFDEALDAEILEVKKRAGSDS